MGRDSPREHAIFRGEISFDVDEAFNSRAAVFSHHQKANQAAHAGNDEKHWSGKERLPNEVCQFGASVLTSGHVVASNSARPVPGKSNVSRSQSARAAL